MLFNISISLFQQNKLTRIPFIPNLPTLPILYKYVSYLGRIFPPLAFLTGKYRLITNLKDYSSYLLYNKSIVINLIKF